MEEDEILRNTFSESDLETLGSLAEQVGRERDPLSVAQLWRDWRQTIEEIEGGYSEMIYEYTNDISSRRILDRIISRCSRPLAEKLEQLLAPLDERFFDLTVEPRGCLVPNIANDKWARIPKHPKGVLLGDLKLFNLL